MNNIIYYDILYYLLLVLSTRRNKYPIRNGRTHSYTSQANASRTPAKRVTKWVLTKWVFCGFEIIKLSVHVLVGMLECVPVTYVYSCPIHIYLATDNKNITSARPLSVAAGFINGLG